MTLRTIRSKGPGGAVRCAIAAAVVVVSCGGSDETADSVAVPASDEQASPISDDGGDPSSGDVDSETSDALRPRLGRPLETVAYDLTAYLRAPLELTPHRPLLFAMGEPGQTTLQSPEVTVDLWNVGSWNTARESVTDSLEGQVSVAQADIVGSIPADDIDAWIATGVVEVIDERSASVAGVPTRVFDLVVSDDAATVSPLPGVPACCVFYADPPVELLHSWGDFPSRLRPMLDTGLRYRMWFVDRDDEFVLVVAGSEDPSELDAVEAEFVPTIRMPGS